MIKCKNDGCSRYGDDRCCCNCNDPCGDYCDANPETCGDSEFLEDAGLTLFQSKAMAVMQTIVDLDRQKKDLETKDKAVRQQLQEVMDHYGIKKFENDILKVTYVEPTTRTTIDSAKLKKELPALAEKYSKTSQVKGSVRIEVK